MFKPPANAFMYSKTVCPQRILNEAIRLLKELEPKSSIQEEEIANNISELEDLIKILPNKV